MISLLCIDVDGTLTDGKIYCGADRSENFKAFNVKDGLGLAYWNGIGRKSAVITGRSSDIVARRAAELGVEHIFMGVSDKGEVVRRLQKELGLGRESCAAVGDDMNDISMFRALDLSFAVADCALALKNIATINLTQNGGSGAVREAIEIILKRENLYEDFIKYWQ